MKSLPVIVLVLSLLASSASAQDIEITDGIYLSTPAGERCVHATYLEHVTMDVVIVCPAYPGFRGMEIGLEMTGRGNTALIPTVPDLVWDPPVDDDPAFYGVSWAIASPIPTSTWFVPMSFDIFYLDSGPITFRIAAMRPSSIPEPLPAYVGDPGDALVPLNPLPTGAGYDFAINADDCQLGPATYTCVPIADEALSWGAVKSLYR